MNANADRNKFVVWRPSSPGHPLDCYLTAMGGWTNNMTLARVYGHRKLAELDAASRRAEVVPLANLRYPELTETLKS